MALDIIIFFKDLSKQEFLAQRGDSNQKGVQHVGHAVIVTDGSGARYHYPIDSIDHIVERPG